MKAILGTLTLFFVAGVIAVTPVDRAVSGTRTIAPTADAYVSEGQATTNFGAAKTLRARDSSQRLDVYVKFDVALSADELLDNAKLRLFATGSVGDHCPTQGIGVDVYQAASNNWSESTITYATAPGRTGSRIAKADNFPGGYYVDFGVTSVVSSATVGGSGTISFVVQMPSCSTDTGYTDFNSKEAGSSTRPRLVVTTTPLTATVAAAGDIACASTDQYFNGGKGVSIACAQKRVSDIIVSGNYDAVLTLGDNQYCCGSLEQFMGSYDLSWGRFKSKTYPSIGNHEYDDPAGGAKGYFDYFGAAAGGRAKGYYSFDLGGWHFISLNTSCPRLPAGSGANGCAEGSPQNDWLEADLAANQSKCTAAFMHFPRWASTGNYTGPAPLWNDLYAANADLVLAGHEHSYERFAPQNPSGALDLTRGIRQITIGTGGMSQGQHPTTMAPNSKKYFASFGILRLRLHASGYEWDFVPAQGSDGQDFGIELCH
jgi:hypothetical protein